MARDEFLKRTSNENTISNYKKSFKKLDEFLQQNEIIEKTFLDALDSLPLHQKYKELQKLVDFIKSNVSAGTTKQYFDNLFIYFLLEGAPLDYTQKKIRLSFPRKTTIQFEGLDEDSVKLLCSCGSVNFQTYLSTLVGAGLRESECLLLKPQMIQFSEYPTRIKLPKEITKFNIPRETFLPSKNSQKLQQLIESKRYPITRQYLPLITLKIPSKTLNNNSHRLEKNAIWTHQIVQNTSKMTLLYIHFDHISSL